MLQLITIEPTLIAFAITLLLIYGFSPLAKRLGLIDKPNDRKTHTHDTPLTGGIAIYLALLICLIIFAQIDLLSGYFLTSTGLIVLCGVLDDRFQLSASVRVGIEIIAASIMMLGARIWVIDLGNLLGFGPIHMPFWLAYPFTLIAVFGILNAINMIDGIDGLAGGIALLTLLILLGFTNNSSALSTTGSYFVGGLLAFLLCNFQVHRLLPRVFLGDAGSKLIGLTLVWFIIESAQPRGDPQYSLDPVTALYIVGLPLIDMVNTTVRRLKKRRHPFRADRTHIHHILQRAGFNKRQTLTCIFTIALLINLSGLFMQYLQVPEVIRFLSFFALYFLYGRGLLHAWKLSKKLKLGAHA